MRQSQQAVARLWSRLGTGALCCLFLVSVLTSASHHDHDHVLCRSCGAELTENSRDNFVNISSPLSEASQQVTILGHPHLMVQTLRNPADLAFDLVTVRRSGCSGVGEWYGEHSWFPGYLWRVCICPRCRAHLGWIFEPETKASTTHFKASSEGFYGLILEKLITEKSPAVLAQWHKTGRTWCLSTPSFWLSWRRKQPLAILRRITSLQSTARRACLSRQYSLLTDLTATDSAEATLGIKTTGEKEASGVKGSTEVMGIIGIVGISGITGGNILTTGKGGLAVTTEIMMTAEGIVRRGSIGPRGRVMSMEEGITSPADTTMVGGHPIEFCESSGWYIYRSSGTSHKLPHH